MPPRKQAIPPSPAASARSTRSAARRQRGQTAEDDESMWEGQSAASQASPVYVPPKKVGQAYVGLSNTSVNVANAFSTAQGAIHNQHSLHVPTQPALPTPTSISSQSQSRSSRLGPAAHIASTNTGDKSRSGGNQPSNRLLVPTSPTSQPQSSSHMRSPSPIAEQINRSAQALSPVRYFLKPREEDGSGDFQSFASAGAAGVLDRSGETSGYNYSSEDEFVRAARAGNGTQARSSQHVDRSVKGASSNGQIHNKNRQSTSSSTARRRGGKGGDDMPYRPTEDDYDAYGSDSTGDGEGLVRRGALDGRAGTRGKRNEKGEGYLGMGLGIRQSTRRTNGVHAEETDEGIEGSPSEDEHDRLLTERDRRGMSKTPMDPAQTLAQEGVGRSPTPIPYHRDRSRTPVPPTSAGQKYAAMVNRRQPSTGRTVLTNILSLLVHGLKWSVEFASSLLKQFLPFIKAEEPLDTSRSRQPKIAWWKSLGGLILAGLVLNFLTRVSPSRRHAVPHYDAPPSTLEELVGRLTEIEHAVSAITGSNAALEKQHRDVSGRIVSIESLLREEQKRSSTNSERLDRIDKADTSNQKAWKEANALSDRIVHRLGEAERELAALPVNIRGVTEQQGRTDKAVREMQGRLDKVESEIKSLFEGGRMEEALAKILPSWLPVRTGQNGREVDPSFWIEMRKVLVGRDEVGDIVRRAIRDADLSPGVVKTRTGNKDEVRMNVEDWRKLEQWKDDFQVKLDSISHSSINKAAFASLFEQSASGLRSAIDELRTLASSAPAPRSSVGASVQHVTYKLSSKEDITSSLLSLIDAALLKYSKDTLARPDYALYSAGARVIPQITTPTLVMHQQTKLSKALWGKKDVEALSPAHALMPGNTPGQCWSFAGQEGQLGIMLKDRVRIGDVTLEHAPKETVGDTGAAPRDVEVWALVEGEEDLEKVKEYYQSFPLPETSSMPPSPDHLLLSSFTYDPSAPGYIQTFPVSQAIRDLDIKTGVVIWKFKSNWGSEAYTCLYRVRVHEVEAEL